jgi:O-antigen/teichoic acid export membrane protein
MLIGKSAINLAANVFSAALGLANVVVFTRWFAPADYGVYVIGLGFASVVSTLLSTWLRLPIMREQARGDGTDIRAYVLIGLAASGLLAPATFLFGLGIGLSLQAATASVLFALAISYYEILQELLRARLQAFTMMKATVLRAILIPSLGLASSLLGQSGILLLLSSALACAIAASAFTGNAWRGITFDVDWSRLRGLAVGGIPLTLSLTLFAVSTMIDRFAVAYVVGSAQSGEYSAGVDLVRQSLIIPAVSLAGVFFPLAVKTLASAGPAAVRRHLEESLELLAAVVVPAAVGLAIVAPHIANLVLGPAFRGIAMVTIPITSAVVLLQIFTYQYLHVSFLLSNRNSFYLINTGITVTANVVFACLLVTRFGSVGAAWARLAAEALGCVCALLLTRRSFPIPLAFARLPAIILASMAMAAAVKALQATLDASDAIVIAVVVPAGILVYSVICLLANVAGARDNLVRGISVLGAARSN